MGKFEELLVNKGLYDNVDITIDDLEELEKYLSKNEYTGNTIDCYCPHCETNRVFAFSNSEIHEETGIMSIMIDDTAGRTRKPKKQEIFNSYLNKRYVLTYRCSRDRQHAILFDLIVIDSKIIKIGQFPSIADLVIPEISKYKSVLGKQYREFSKAVGLFVSKGIHELSEEECREMFPYIRIGIELILDDLLAEKERKEKEKVFEEFVAKKTGELRQ